MKHTWVDAGYLIVSDAPRPDPAFALQPPRIVTVSTCIVESYPDAWALPWVQTSSSDLDKVRAALALDELALADLRTWVGDAIERGEYGWPNVFLSLRAARDFARCFLAAVKNRRLVGLSLVEDIAYEFVREESPPQGHGGPGVWTALSRNVPLAAVSAPLGFDVLGAEYGGSFHTFTCNGLERAYSERLGTKFNRYGLIEDYAMAVAASEYTNREDVGAEPVDWYPFRVDEYEIT